MHGSALRDYAGRAYWFLLSLIPRHIGYQGKPLASRPVSKDELALGRVMRELKASLKSRWCSDEDLICCCTCPRKAARDVAGADSHARHAGTRADAGARATYVEKG